MLSSHVGTILHRDIVGLRLVRSRPSSGGCLRLESRKGGVKIRNFCARVQREEEYRPSYDVRKTQKTQQWPKNRREELEQLAKKVHPDATVKKADPGSFSFRVRVDERVSAPSDDVMVDPAVGLLKPPPIIQKSDPFVLQQHKKRNERRVELLGLLRSQDDTLTVNQVNDYYDKLRALDFEDMKEGFEPQYFTRAQLMNEGVISTSKAFPGRVSDSIDSPRSNIGKLGNEEWSLVDNAVRRKFVEDLLANEIEQAKLATEMPSTGRRLTPRTDTLAYLNQLSLRRLFGLCVQTLLVAPWAIARSFARMAGLTKKETFWQFESDKEAQLYAKQLKARQDDMEAKLKELKDKKKEVEARFSKAVVVGAFLRSYPLRVFIFTLKTVSWYPLLLAYSVAKYTSIWLYFSVVGTFDVLKRLAIASSAVFGGKNGRLASMAATTWNGLAPHTWKRYYLGDPLGTLWDRHTGHSEQVLQQSMDAFHSIGYTLERSIFGFLHSNRFVGFLLLLAFAIITSQSLIDPDFSYLEDLNAISKAKSSQHSAN